MKIISIVNQKGGCGKTTTSVNLAAALNIMGYKTLLVDTDPQCNATDTYRAETSNMTTLYDIMVNRTKGAVEEAIQHMAPGDIIPSDPLLKNAEQLITVAGKENILAKALKKLEGVYDYIIIDTPPQTGILQQNALVASNAGCIIPMAPERYSFQGLSDLMQAIQDVRDYTQNEDLAIKGILVVKAKPRNRLTRETLDAIPAIAEQIGTKVYGTSIREAAAIGNSQAAQLDIFSYEKTDRKARPVAEDYMEFAKEVAAE